MNKQELIEKVNKIAIDTPFPNAKIVDHSEVIKLIEQLDKPQKVTVPQIVADYIKYAKEVGWDLLEAMKNVPYEDNAEFRKWFYKGSNVEVFAAAWVNGFHIIEKEKRYLVKMKNIHNYSSILKRDDITKKYFFGNEVQMCASSSTHTRKELEEAGFGEVFNSQLFEVDEVYE